MKLSDFTCPAMGISSNGREGGESMEQKVVLPKNIKQIGEKDSMYYVYLEDYVHTYIRKLSVRDNNTLRVGFLIGKKCKADERVCQFVEGALEVEYGLDDSNNITFTDEALDTVQEEIIKYFPDSEVCGWFVKGSEDTMPDLYSIKNTQNEYFVGQDMLLYFIQGNETCFFAQSEDSYISVKGYYIYYDRNEEMQDYMVSRTKTSHIDSSMAEFNAKSIRDNVNLKKNEILSSTSKSFIIKVVMAAVAVILIFTVIFAISSIYSRMGTIENSLNGFSKTINTLVSNSEKQTAAGNVAVNNVEGQVPEHNTPTAETTVQQTQTAAQMTETAAVPATESTAAMSVNDPNQVDENGYRYHIVQRGETLISISRLYYGNGKRVDDICALNNLTKDQFIFSGQKILLPAAQ